MKGGVATALGAIYGLACLFLAFLNSGGGHGWMAAMPISFLGLPLIVAGFHSAGTWRLPGKDKVAAVSIGLLVLLDIALIVATESEGVRYFKNTGAGGQVWLGMWLLAHAPPVLVLYWNSQSAWESEP